MLDEEKEFYEDLKMHFPLMAALVIAMSQLEFLFKSFLIWAMQHPSGEEPTRGTPIEEITPIEELSPTKETPIEEKTPTRATSKVPLDIEDKGQKGDM
jgi:hypothetical protein